MSEFEKWRDEIFDEPKYLGKDLALEAWNLQQKEIDRLKETNVNNDRLFARSVVVETSKYVAMVNKIDKLKTNLSTLAKAYKEQSEILHNFTPENKWEECRSDGNIFDTVDGDPIWVFNEDDCGGYARQYVNSTTHQEALEIIKELEK